MPQRVLTESEFNAIRDQVLAAAPDNLSAADFQRTIGPAMEQALGQAENSSAPIEGPSVARFAAGVWRTVNPMGLIRAAMDPKAAVKGIIDAHAAQLDKAKSAYDEGRYVEAAGHLTAAAVPLIGPAAAHAGETIASGDVAGGLGEATALLAPAARKPIGQATSATGRVVQAVAESAPMRKMGTYGAAGAALSGRLGTAAAAAAAPTVLSKTGQAMQVVGDALAGAPAAATGAAATAADQLKAALSSGEQMPAARFMELLQQVPPNERGAILQARQAAVRAAASQPAPPPTVETPPQTPAPPVAPSAPAPAGPPPGAPQGPPPPPGPPPQAPPAAAQAPAGAPPAQQAAQPPGPPPQAAQAPPGGPQGAAPPAAPPPPPTVDPLAQEPPPHPTSDKGTQPPQPQTPKPDVGRTIAAAYQAAQDAFDALGVTPQRGDLANATSMAKYGKPITQAVQEIVQRRQTAGAAVAPVDPAAQLRDMMGTPTDEQVAAAVRKRIETMSAGTLAPYVFPQCFDDDGHPLDGGLLYTYQAGTSTPAVTYHDGELLIPQANPITLTAGGRYKIYLPPSSFKFVLKDFNGQVIDTTDPVNSVGLVTSGVLGEFSFFGDPTSPITATDYPTGPTYDACHAGTAILPLDSANLSAGTYVLQGMVSNLTGVATTVALVNLTDGAPDTPIASMTSASTSGTPVASGPCVFAVPGAVKQYGIKTKVASGGGFAWAIQLIKVA